jgi:uroporphyrinogen decarboxylase
MTKRERVEATYRIENHGRPPFVPAIYEHKGKLIGKSPSEICRNADFLAAGLLREAELYDPDMLVVGIDVYNVEAEALGSRVVYFAETNDVPAIADPVLRAASGLDRLGVPDPERDGRMPVYLQAAAEVQRALGKEMIVRGALSGPFSMAAALAGTDNFLMACLEDPGFVRRAMEFTAQVTVAFGKSFIGRGVEPILFDSWATPQMCSPRVFHEHVAPLYRDYVIPEFRAAGARFVPLIIGGKTDAVIDDLIATGCDQLLADAPANRKLFLEKCGAARKPFRANVRAQLVHSGPVEEIRRRSIEILGDCAGYPGFLFGCGVVAYDCPAEHVLVMREALEEIR